MIQLSLLHKRTPLAIVLVLAAIVPASAREVEEIVSTNMGAVVIVYGNRADNGAQVQGSGVCIDPRGYVLVTAHQVVGVENLNGKLRSGESFTFTLVEVAVELELALLQADRAMPAAVGVGSTAGLNSGAGLVAIASPRDLAFTTVTGIVSRPDSKYQGYSVFLADLPATHGSSGAPVFDRGGRLVGLISGEIEDFDDFTIVNAIDNAHTMLRKHGLAVPPPALVDSTETELVPVSGITEREFRAIEAFNMGVRAPAAGDKVRSYTTATQLLPDFFEAQFNLAVASQAAHDPVGAEQAYQVAARIRPEALAVKRNLGRLYLRSKRVQDALAIFESAVRIAPADAQAHNDLGEALRQSGKADQAINHFNEALQIDPNYGVAHFNAALTHANAGQAAKAIEHFKRYLELTPGAEDSEEVRAWIAQLEAAV